MKLVPRVKHSDANKNVGGSLPFTTARGTVDHSGYEQQHNTLVYQLSELLLHYSPIHAHSIIRTKLIISIFTTIIAACIPKNDHISTTPTCASFSHNSSKVSPPCLFPR